MRRIQISLAAVVIALAVCVPAYASGSSALRSAYGSTPHNVGAVVAKTTKPKAKPVRTTPAKPVATVRSTGTLPFTGMDLGVGAAAAVALIGAGLAFRRLGRQPS